MLQSVRGARSIAQEECRRVHETVRALGLRLARLNRNSRRLCGSARRNKCVFRDLHVCENTEWGNTPDRFVGGRTTWGSHSNMAAWRDIKMAVGKMAFRSARSARSAPRDLASELKVAEESKDWLACLRITQDVVKYEADLALAAAKTLSAPKPKMSTAEASLHRQGSAIHEADEALAALSFLKPTSKLPVAEANFVRHVEEAGQRLGSKAAKLQHVRAYRQRFASIQCSANEASPASVFRMVKNIWAESSCTCFDEEEVMAPRPEQPDRHFRSPLAGSKVCLAGRIREAEPIYWPAAARSQPPFLMIVKSSGGPAAVTSAARSPMWGEEPARCWGRLSVAQQHGHRSRAGAERKD